MFSTIIKTEILNLATLNLFSSKAFSFVPFIILSFGTGFNCLPNVKISELCKMKALADNRLTLYEIAKFELHQIETIFRPI